MAGVSSERAVLPTRQAEPELVVENKRAGDSRPQNQSSNQRGNRPYELLVSKLVDSLETPSLIQSKQLPIPVIPRRRTDQPSLTSDSILTECTAYTNATNDIMRSRKR